MPAATQDLKPRGFIIPIGGAEGRSRKPGILTRFAELCGGEDARIMVIPTASLRHETGPEYTKLFRSMGAKSMCVPIESREDCFETETLRILENATGIFITGGNQLRLSTILGGTPVARRIRKLNSEGIHVAGTSAGAAIVSEHMIAGGRSGPSPRESGVELAPGLGLTNRAIIDQHFNKRGRMGRLLAALSCPSGGYAYAATPAALIPIFERLAEQVLDRALLRHLEIHDRLPANILQAQRDYFGAHTYERVDKPRGEFFHTNWTGRGGTTAASTYIV